MGFGKTITRAVEAPQHNRERPGVITSFGGFDIEAGLLHATGGAPWEISGNSYIDVYRGVLSIPGVWRAANLLADLLGSVPWDAYTTHGKDTPEILSPCPALLDQPSPPDTRMTTFSSLALDLVLEGNAIAIIAARDGQGYPTAITPVPAAWCGVYRELQDDGTFRTTYNIQGKDYDYSDVIHIKGITVPGQVRGMGLIEAHFFHTLRLAHNLNQQAGDVDLNAVPTGVFQSGNPDLTSDDAEATKAGWQRSMRTKTIAVIGPNDKFTPLSWNPEQAQLIEARQFSLLELALLFGLPPSFLGAATGGSTLNYTTAETENTQLLRFSMNGHLVRMEQALSLAFPRGTTVQADLDSFLRSDMLTRYQAYALGIQADWLQRSEVREKEKLKPIPGIDNDPENAGTQLKMNKDLPVTTPGLTQVKVPASGPLAPQNLSAPVVQPPVQGKATP